MSLSYVHDERRKCKRFRIKDESSFVLSPAWPDKGILVDISRGGVAFHYTGETPWPDTSADGCMVFGDHDSCLADVPTEMVADRIVRSTQGNTLVVRRRSLKFGPLSEHQKFMLECFIWVNCAAEC